MDCNFENISTPSFIFDYEEFTRSIGGFRKALDNAFGNYGFSISVKTITVPAILKIARDEGCMAEVVSYDEYNLAKLCGFKPESIIYNGPLKSEDTFIDAVIGGAIVNIETKRELEWLRKLPADKTYKVGIRLSINISHTSPEDAYGDNDFSRFGFSDETGDFLSALQAIDHIPNVSVNGLQIHKIAHNRSPRVYANNISYAARLIHRYGLKLDYLDVGGGFFGIFAGKPTYVDYASKICESMSCNGLTDLKLYVEPGNAILASSISFLTSVIDMKKTSDYWIATIDGSRNDVDPLFHKKDYIKEIIYGGGERKTALKQLVGGCTCMEADRLFLLENSPCLAAGDKILFRNVGAYTMTLSPQFIRFWPRIYAYRDYRYELIREASTPEYIMDSCKL